MNIDRLSITCIFQAMLKQFKKDSIELKKEEEEALRKFDLNILEQLDQQVYHNQ